MQSLDVELELTGDFELKPEQQNYRIEKATAQVFLKALSSNRQTVSSADSDGDIADNSITFQYRNLTIGKHDYQFTSLIITQSEKVPITKKLSSIPPLRNQS